MAKIFLVSTGIFSKFSQQFSELSFRNFLEIFWISQQSSNFSYLKWGLLLLGCHQYFYKSSANFWVFFFFFFLGGGSSPVFFGIYSLHDLAQFCAKSQFTFFTASFRISSIFPYLAQKKRFLGFHLFQTMPVSHVGKWAGSCHSLIISFLEILSPPPPPSPHFVILAHWIKRV